MIDIFFETGISNAIFSFAIAIVALIIGKFSKKPHLAYMLWLLVLVKLLMPSFLMLPVFLESESIAQTQLVNTIGAKSGIIAQPPDAAIFGNAYKGSLSFFGVLSMIRGFGQLYLPIIWGCGILIALAWSFMRVFRFNRLLRASSTVAPQAVYGLAEEIADKLNIRNIPLINITSAKISPMVWWLGGKVRIFIPSTLIENLEPEELRLVLAHELAHVRRRDYLVRWVEWSAAVLFWWNPIVWLAQRNLRANEEICCDALVLSNLKPAPHQYAASLFSAVENFADSAFRPPSMASEVNSGGYLIRRIHMILSNKNNRTLSGRMQVLVLFIAATILPLGLINAQEKKTEVELKEIRAKLKADVKAGRISPKEAKKRAAKINREIINRQALKKLNAAVKAGKLTAEEAKAKLKGLEKHRTARSHQINKFKQVAEKIQLAERKGEISAKEAKLKNRELKKSYALSRQAANLKDALVKTQWAVETNRISATEAEERMRGIRQHFVIEKRNADLKMVAKKLKMAVKTNSMSAKEAEVRMSKLKQNYAKEQKSIHYKQAKEKLKAAVEAKKISVQEAKVKLAALEKEFNKSESDN